MDDFKHFISFCNNYATSGNYKSNIRFTASPPSKTADFLDTTVSVNPDGSLSTNLFCKPTASYQYLHNSSYHPKHVTNSLPKSQLMRIRRICSNLSDYETHAKRFVDHFIKRNYHHKPLTRMVQEVKTMNREELLQYKKRDSSANNRIPLVLAYHHKLEGIGGAIKGAYKQAIMKYPSLKSLFPEPPMVAFRRAPNLRDKLVRAKHQNQPDTTADAAAATTTTASQGHSQLEKQMNRSHSITNPQTQRTCRINGGAANIVGSVYAAECTKHKKLYVGQTGRPLNCRFNNHRSDAKHRPYTCKLAEHFHENSCSMDTDLRVSVLEQVSGSQALREYREDKWITRLQTQEPTGFNSNFRTEYGPIHAKLFM